MEFPDDDEALDEEVRALFGLTPGPPSDRDFLKSLRSDERISMAVRMEIDAHLSQTKRMPEEAP